MHYIVALLLFLIGFQAIHSYDNCNNNYSVNYCEKLFGCYQQAELKEQQKLYARKILGFAAINAWPLKPYQLDTLQNAYNIHGCSIFPSLIEKNKIRFSKTLSPIQNASHKDIEGVLGVKNQDLHVILNVFKDSLQFTTYVKNQKIASVNKSVTDFIDVEINTFFKDSAWYASVYSYNMQKRNKVLFSFLLDGSYSCHTLPENFNEKKFCESQNGLLFMTSDLTYEGLECGKYNVSIQFSKQDHVSVLKSIVIPCTQYNPQYAMNVVSIEHKNPVLVWADQHLFVQDLLTDKLVDLGQLHFSSVSKISFSNNGRIVWIEGCPQQKDLSHGLIQAWNLKEMKRERNWCSAVPFARNYTFSPNGVFGLGFDTSHKMSNLFLCDASNGNVLAQFKIDKQVYDYSFKTNSEIIINCGKEGWYTIDITNLQMANWIAKKKSVNEVAQFLASLRNQLFQDALTDSSKDQVFDLSSHV